MEVTQTSLTASCALGAFLLFAGCVPAADRPLIGQVAQISKKGEGIFCFNDRNSLKYFLKAVAASDSYGVSETTLDAVQLHSGEHVRNIGSSGSPHPLFHLRIESGDDARAACWVDSEWEIYVNVRSGS